MKPIQPLNRIKSGGDQMTFKSMIVTLGTFLLTTGILYLIGHSFSITSLMFQYEFSSDSDGFFISGGSLLPLIIGLIASYLAEKIYVHRHRQE
jgi:ribose/xylose/arabinose/galactoside ABC-type transport system permease subunit